MNSVAESRATSGLPRITVGQVLLAIAAVHSLVGMLGGLGLHPNIRFGGAPPLTAMWREGVVASVGADPWRVSVTWFLLWGVAFGLVGLLAHQIERTGLLLSRSFGAALGALCLVGVLLMPESGFWLGIVPVALIFRRAR